MAKWWKSLAIMVGSLGVVGLATGQAPDPNDSGKASVTDGAGAAPPAASVPAAAPGMAYPNPYLQPMPFVAAPPPVGGYTTSGTAGPNNAFRVDPLPHIPPTMPFVSFDYLLWYLPRQPIPPLVTIGSAADRVPGALDQPGTVVAFDAVREGAFQFSGTRFTLGSYLDHDHVLSLQAGIFLLEKRTAFQGVHSDGSLGSDPISRPFFNVNLNRFDADPIAYPGVMQGRALIELPTRFYGAEFLARYNYETSNSTMRRKALLGGFRYLALDEALRLTQRIDDIPGFGDPGNTYSLYEEFLTRNRFYGGQVGGEAECRFGPLAITFIGKLGLGVTQQEVNIGGATRVDQPGGRVNVSQDRALLVQPSNAGTYFRNAFSIVPEGEVQVGYDFNEHVRLSVGYTFIYWSHVLRPGEQIDPSINIQALQPFDQVGPAKPAWVATENNQFWAQGLSLSLLLSY